LRLGKRYTGGPVIKKDFTSLSDAKDWFFGEGQSNKANPGAMTSLKKQAGASAFELSPSQIAEAAAAFRILGRADTLTEAVQYFVKHARPVGGVYAVQDAIDVLIKDKEAAGKGQRHLKGLRWNLERFSEDFPKAHLHEIRREQIEEWLEEEDFSPATRSNYLRDLSILYNFALTREWVAKTPLLGITKPTPSQGEVKILTPQDTAEFLHTAEQVAPEIVAALAIKFFAGLRTSELFSLDWTLVNDQITILAKTAKTRKRRVVTVSENLQEWLARYRGQSGSVSPRTHNAWHRRLEMIETAVTEKRKEASKKPKDCVFRLPSNCARHSFCSYHFAGHRNENLTAAEAGNSPNVIFSNYRALVQPVAASQYWKIVPSVQ
jgi:site-specific recombinase XerD